jgi:stage IV sporulation protein B
MGCAVGIKLFSDGVLVVGLAPEESPARSMGLRPGDVITHVNANEVDTVEQLQTLLDTLAGQQLTLRVDRDGEELTLVRRKQTVEDAIRADSYTL